MQKEDEMMKMKYRYKKEEDKLRDHQVYYAKTVTVITRRGKGLLQDTFKFDNIYVRFARESLELSDHKDFYPQLMYFPLREVTRIDMDIEEVETKEEGEKG